MRRFSYFVTFATIAGMLAFSISNYLTLRHLTSVASHQAQAAAARQDSASPVGGDTTTKVVAMGRLEPSGGVIDLSGLTGDRLAKIDVSEGEDVKIGQVLAIFESRTLREAETEAAKAALADAVARGDAEKAYAMSVVSEAELAERQVALAELDVQAQQAQLRVVSARLDTAKNDLARLEAVDGEIVSPQELEHQRLLVHQATEELSAAETQMAKLRGAVEVNRASAKAKLTTAKAALARVEPSVQRKTLEHNVALAEARLATTVLVAPSDGRVLKILIQPGETMGAGPIIRMGDVDPMRVLAEVYETDVGRIRVGQRARITSPALPGPLDGVVESIGLMVGKNQVASLDPTQPADLRIVEVLVRLSDSADAARLANLQVTVEIDAASSGATAMGDHAHQVDLSRQ